ncbi:MAG TPA: nickel pincer cofactor biosynthesis protein LarC [Candidatus Acidoferrum sp.]|nr:nickel pincer cofactor biosynthesis protein LarC [Candidatus Acidoferrum sp.]
MTRIAYVDVVGGAAGDMLLASLLDAGAPLAAVVEAIEAVLPGRFTISVDSVHRAGLRASMLRALPTAGGSPRPEPSPGRRARELLASIQAASLPDGVRRAAAEVILRLSEAEARVHGRDVAHLELDELGSDDTLLDVVGVAAALDALGIERLLVSSLPIAVGGTLAGSHANWPLPPPATLELLRGFDIRGVTNGELVTPTAAALFAALAVRAPQPPPMTVEAIGYGAGTNDWDHRPNIVRVIMGTVAEIPQGRQISLLEANVDDLSPQLVADAVQALREAGALDVWTTPVHMKKDRAGVLLAALCEPSSEATLAHVFFETTPTFGVRLNTIRRLELERTVRTLTLPDGSVSVKLGILNGRVMSATPEHDDVAALARRINRPVRMVHDEATAAARNHWPPGTPPTDGNVEPR